MIFSFSLTNCAREMDECNGPLVDKSKLLGLRASLFSAGPTAALIIPNPMEASRNDGARASDRSLLKFANGLLLPDLLQSSRLESDLVKVRPHGLSDAASSLAVPNAKGEFSFEVTDVHYSETMAYQSVTNILRYVEALGFGLLRDRPLYVVVQAQEEGVEENFLNAFYEHHFFETTKPRQMKLFGSAEYAPGLDRDMYWHESGHYINESVSADIGIDRAGEMGAVYTEGSALHECIADHIAQSFSNKSHIGKWIAPNFEGYSPGQPLRSAVDTDGSVLMYDKVAVADGQGTTPERYGVAEWCTRVLWQIRNSFVSEDGDTGSFFSDRLMLSAVSQLPKDASIKNFYQSLVKSDEQLHCGLHQRSINNAFASRGFQTEPASLSQPLTLFAEPYATQVDSGSIILFKVRVANPSGEIARNVRLVLESQSNALIVAQPIQGLGDLAPGAEILVGASSTGLSDAYSPSALKDERVSGSAAFILKAVPENGPETYLQGKVP